MIKYNDDSGVNITRLRIFLWLFDFVITILQIINIITK